MTIERLTTECQFIQLSEIKSYLMKILVASNPSKIQIFLYNTSETSWLGCCLYLTIDLQYLFKLN